MAVAHFVRSVVQFDAEPQNSADYAKMRLSADSDSFLEMYRVLNASRSFLQSISGSDAQERAVPAPTRQQQCNFARREASACEPLGISLGRPK